MHGPLPHVPPAPARRAAPIRFEDRAAGAVPEAADLHAAPGVDPYEVHGQQLVVQLRLRDLHADPIPRGRGGEEGIRAVPAARIPSGRVLVETSVLPDLHDPRGQQVLHLRQRPCRVALRVGAAVGNVDAAVAEEELQQERLDSGEGPLAGGFVLRPHRPRWQQIDPQPRRSLDEVVALVDGAVVAGHRLRSEERQPGDRVPGQFGHQRRRGAGVGPFRLRAPVRPHRQRQQHVPQQHCHLHRRLRPRSEAERDDRVGAGVQRDRQVHRDRLGEDVVHHLHRQRRRIEDHHLSRPADVHGSFRHPCLGGRGRRADVALASAARPEPFPPHLRQGRAVRYRNLAVGKALTHVLVDQPLLRGHAHPRAVQ
ncbi:hypothetical protein SAVIM40S_00367 [Streptomyces avidinii]